MSTYLVTGTNRGLGLALIRVLAEQGPGIVKQVFATTRRDEPGQDLGDVIRSSNGRVKHIKLVVDSSSSIAAAASAITGILNGGGLDYLINNAAVREPSPCVEIENMTFLREALDTNVVGTHQVTAAFLPLLRAGQGKKILFVSSTLGCITTAQTDPSLVRVPLPAYKVSKAGTHMLMILWSNRLKDEGFCVYMQSPGNLKTELAGGDKADLHPDVGAREVVRILQNATSIDTGRHMNIYVKGWENGGGVGGKYDGGDLPW